MKCQLRRLTVRLAVYTNVQTGRTTWTSHGTSQSKRVGDNLSKRSKGMRRIRQESYIQKQSKRCRRQIMRGQVYYIEGRQGTIGSEARKSRPGIIVSNNTNNYFSPTVEVVFTTSQPRKHILPTQFITQITPCPSTVMCEGVTTVDKSRLQRFIGTLPTSEREQLDRCLAVSLGLSHEV